MSARDGLRLIGAIVVSAIPALAVMVPLVWWLQPSIPFAGLTGIIFGCSAVVAGNVWYFLWLERQP